MLSLHVYVVSDNDIDFFHIQQFNDRYWICETCMYVCMYLICVCVCVCARVCVHKSYIEILLLCHCEAS
jgi:hypothetical protein